MSATGSRRVPGRLQTARRRNIRRAVGADIVGSLGADRSAGRVGDELICNSPSGAKYRLVVDLISDADPRPNPVRIDLLVKRATAVAGEDRRPGLASGIGVWHGRSELAYAPILLMVRSRQIIPKTVIERELAGDLPGILSVQGPLLAPPHEYSPAASAKWSYSRPAGNWHSRGQWCSRCSCLTG